MTTITFYSYKGGVGRTLVVANVARYLSRFGQKVFAIDFDLEAPGLHYKLTLDDEEKRRQITQGLVDYIYAFAVVASPPGPLSDYVIQLQTRSDADGAVWMMPAGNVPCSEYWKRLARLNWHDLFYEEGAKGVPFFFELKARIRKEFAPDFLLIDARTGITEIGGIATTLLPDTVVCFLLNNQENLEGAREVLRSIKGAPKLPGQPKVELLPVLTRIPETEGAEQEGRIVASVRDFLNEEADDLPATLNIPEVLVLHSEPELELSESLRIGSKKSVEESPLLRDYLRLFGRLIPRGVIDPHIDRIVKEVVDRLLDDPEGVQQDLEEVAVSYPHPEAYRALLKVHRLRGAKDDAVLRAASRLWEITGKPEEPILWEAVRKRFTPFYSWMDRPCSLEFVEAVWRAAGATDTEVGVKLSQSYSNLREKKRAAALLREILGKGEPTEAAVAAYLDLLSGFKSWLAASELIERVKSSLNESAKFHTAWAKVLLAKGDRQEILAGLRTGEPNVNIIRGHDPVTYVSLVLTAGIPGQPPRAFLSEYLRKQGPSEEVFEIGDLFRKAGRAVEFEEEARAVFGPEAGEVLGRAFGRKRPL